MKTHHLLVAEFNKQQFLDDRVNAFAHETATPTQRREYALVNGYAAIKEITEALDELSWKPWASAEFFNRKAFLGELADVQLFLHNLLLIALEDNGDELASVHGLSDEFDKILFDKIHNAIRRQQEGYDGIKDKCPKCKRDKTAAQLLLGQLLCPCGFNWEVDDD